MWKRRQAYAPYLLPMRNDVRTSSLRVFCTLEELESWIRLLVTEKGWGWIGFVGSEDLSTPATTEGGFVLPKEARSVFLFPKEAPPKARLTHDEIKARSWGWIYIIPGYLLQASRGPGILLLSEIHASDPTSMPDAHGVRDLNWLKRKLKGEAISGVRGRSGVLAGTEVTDHVAKRPMYHVYRDLRYTRGASALFKSGVLWKQHPSYRAVFEPAGSL